MPSHLNTVLAATLSCLASTLLLTSCKSYDISHTVTLAPSAMSESTSTTESSVNIRNFSPIETSISVEASTLNLPDIFEQLGPDATLWYQHVQTLANPIMQGRAPGTHGIELAAEYIEFYLRMYGLTPAFPESADTDSATLTSYRQPFSFRNPRPSVELEEAHMTLGDDDLELDTDYVVLGVSTNGRVTAPVAFVGYGIGEGPEDYSSFDEDTDLTGRIALLMRYEPLDDDGRSQWRTERRNFSTQAGLARKFAAVVERGAAGIMLVNPPECLEGKTGLESLTSSARFGSRLDIPVVQISQQLAGRILKQAGAIDGGLLAYRKQADQSEFRTVELRDDVEITIAAELNIDDELHTENVGGILAGKGDLADEWIVLGAHYDHVGFGYTGARPNNIGKLHPGADDNASGTAGILLLARRLAKQYAASDEDDLRSVLLMTFSAEEAGLHGSRYYVKHPSFSNEDVSIMINMDMIGRLRSNELSVSGTGTAEEFDELLPRHFGSSGMNISQSPGGRGPSDHTNFYNVGIPVLFPFTGVHNDYHQPTDHAYTVNPAGAMKVLDLIESLVLEVAALDDQLSYIASSASPATGRRTASKVRLGVMPAYGTELETGLKIESVFDDTSASEGGMEDDDIILEWNGEEMTGGQKLFELLGSHEPGDQVNMLVLRDGKEVTLTITLKARATPE